MPNDKLPQSVTAKKLVDSGAKLAGFMAADRLARVADAVENIPAKIAVELAFSRNASYKAIIDLQIIGNVEMQCQRCLAPVTVPLKIENSLTIVAHDEEAKSRIKELEPIILEEGILDIDTLVEEEILLGLPLIAMHSLRDSIGLDEQATTACDLSLDMVSDGQSVTDFDQHKMATKDSDRLTSDVVNDQVEKIERRSEVGMDNPFDVLKTLKAGGGQE